MTRPSLPSRLQELEEEITRLFGHDISWIHDPAIKGAMCSSVADGVPVVRYREFTEAGAAHELLHLQLMGSSYPQIRCYDNQRHARGAATMLCNCLQHSRIFPLLESWGYPPRDTEREGVRRHLAKLRTAEFSPLESEFGFEALLAMLYVRAHLDCAAPELAAELAAICPPGTWMRVEQMGTDVIGTLRNAPVAVPADAMGILRTCLDLLGISGVASVDAHGP